MECSGDEETGGQGADLAGDVNDPVVLIEDVARMVGYDQIPVAPQPSMPSVGLRVMTDRLRQVVLNTWSPPVSSSAVIHRSSRPK